MIRFGKQHIDRFGFGEIKWPALRVTHEGNAEIPNYLSAVGALAAAERLALISATSVPSKSARRFRLSIERNHRNVDVSSVKNRFTIALGKEDVTESLFLLSILRFAPPRIPCVANSRPRPSASVLYCVVPL